MKPSTPVELENFVPTKHARRRRVRPPPRWLKLQATAQEAVAQRRVLLMLSVLSGEKPVTDAIKEAGISRQLYYQLEERALKGMLKALSPAAVTQTTAEVEAAALRRELDRLYQRINELEKQKRRAERLLLLTRKVLPDPMKPELLGRPKRRSTTAGPKPLPASEASTTESPTNDNSSMSPGEKAP